ncbi:MAG: cytidylyltransferase domain-containing protein [Bacteroidota bacterium]|jgi:CMP-N,N'-diacetyllegionaminic acid synthase|nr:acylneuraminate cytidylyltransferase family protein [Sediminibacterium sp.]
MKKILWIVVARSGSKAIPGKNIKLLGGVPLMAYRIKSALSSKYSNDIWISSDSEDYAKIAEEYGAKKMFIRPAELADDNASSSDVLLHAMNFALSIKQSYELIGLLEPTSPFVTTLELDLAIDQLDASDDATAIVAIKESRPNTIFIQEESLYLEILSKNIESMKIQGRQAFKKEITPSGGFYISKWDTFLKSKTFYTNKTLGFELKGVSTLEIDEPDDWQFADYIVKNKLFKNTNNYDI